MGEGRAGTFAQLLRRHRLAAGLSQGALAERAGLSVRGLSDLERGVKTAPHREMVALLGAALGLGPEDRAALEAAVPRRRMPRGALRAAPPHAARRPPCPAQRHGAAPADAAHWPGARGSGRRPPAWPPNRAAAHAHGAAWRRQDPSGAADRGHPLRWPHRRRVRRPTRGDRRSRLGGDGHHEVVLILEMPFSGSTAHQRRPTAAQQLNRALAWPRQVRRAGAQWRAAAGGSRAARLPSPVFSKRTWTSSRAVGSCYSRVMRAATSACWWPHADRHVGRRPTTVMAMAAQAIPPRAGGPRLPASRGTAACSRPGRWPRRHSLPAPAATPAHPASLPGCRTSPRQ